MNQYFYLLSEASQAKTDFSTRLGRPYKIGRDENLFVSLSELTIPNEIESTFVKQTSSKFPLEFAIHIPFLTQKFLILVLPPAAYNSGSLCAKLNGILKEKLGSQFTQDLCRFYYNKQTGKSEIFVNGDDTDINKRVTVIIFAGLATKLGFSNDESMGDYIFGSENDLLPGRKPLHAKHAIAANESPLKGEFDFIFVYLSIIETQVR